MVGVKEIKELINLKTEGAELACRISKMARHMRAVERAVAPFCRQYSEMSDIIRHMVIATAIRLMCPIQCNGWVVATSEEYDGWNCV